MEYNTYKSLPMSHSGSAEATNLTDKSWIRMATVNSIIIRYCVKLTLVRSVHFYGIGYSKRNEPETSTIT